MKVHPRLTDFDGIIFKNTILFSLNNSNYVVYALLTKDHRYTGLEDFGNEINHKIASSEKANHCLVLMWQSLADNFTQPIAIFASKGSVKGNNKLIKININEYYNT